MTELDNIYNFFTQNDIVKDCVSIKKIEEKAGIPTRSLYSFLRGEKYRYLTDEQIDNLIPVIVRIGYKPLNSDDIFL